MHVHSEPFVHPHVKIDVAVSAARITIGQAANSHLERLLVQSPLVGGPHVNFTNDSGRCYIRYRFPVSIFFNVHGTDIEDGRRRVIRLDFLRSRQGIQVATPFSSDQFQTCKTQRYRFRPSLCKHPNESNRPKVRYAADLIIKFPHRNLELVPPNNAFFLVCRRHRLLKRVRDVVFSNVKFSKVLRPQRNLVLKVTLNGGQGYVLVDVFRVWNGCACDWIAIG